MHFPKRLLILLLFVLLVAGGGFYLYYYHLRPTSKNQQAELTDPHLKFVNEVYDKIENGYWDKITDEQIGQIYLAAIDKVTNIPPPAGGPTPAVAGPDRASVLSLISKTLETYPDVTKKNEFLAQITDMVLANLQPFGRSRLYSQKEEKALSDNVKNITGTDQYQVLAVPKDASQSAIDQSYQQKLAENKDDPEKLQQVEKAHQVLGDQAARKNYDTAGIEPTMEYKLLTPDIYYIHITKFSPTTPEELNKIASLTDSAVQNPTTLIFDLRDNIGGAIDGLPWFLGPFIGPDQYAYQFYHQGDKTDFKTKMGWLPGLVKFKKVIVLINQNSQSTAEVMAGTLKKYNVGILVGTPTKGWGTVENVISLDNQPDPTQKFSLFLVHSLTLRDDGEPIEGKGVEPHVNIKNADWEKELNVYTHYPELNQVIKGLFQ